MEKTELIKQIIDQKNEINDIYETKLFPAKKKLEELMNFGASEICPFKIGDDIEFENGKKGKITEISYFSIDFFLNSFNIPPATKLDYEEAETFDPSNAVIIDYNQKEFSFTWEIRGFMYKKNGDVGKVPFIPKNPYYNKFEKNKVFEKNLRNTLDANFLFDIK